MKPLVYLDNAATSYPKPESVYAAVSSSLRLCAGNPGRSAHKAAVASAAAVYKAREILAEYFGADEPERVVFTLNATHALNTAIKGIVRGGGCVLISDVEHNAVFRPLSRLEREKKIRIKTFSTSPSDPARGFSSFCEALTPDVVCVVMTGASNVDGRILPYREAAAKCRERGIPFILDASQLAGHEAIEVDRFGITALCAPGHKGLLGPMGSGILILGKNAPRLDTLTEGGNGYNSGEREMGDLLPERYEAGTVAVPAIAGLAAGAKYLLHTGKEAVRSAEIRLKARLLEILSSFPELAVYAASGPIPVVSVAARDRSPAALAKELADRGVCTRAGLHCAPLAHKALGTLEAGGTLRVSAGLLNTENDLTRFCAALKTALKKKGTE
ncbi:MAG: aminotransferase class V-fold PLP-dependent enzyme [Clostridia bacterium]|nr:aminotransferase class V-fold PLP-dependent enzyme [Clostridia bacterium]